MMNSFVRKIAIAMFILCLGALITPAPAIAGPEIHIAEGGTKLLSDVYTPSFSLYDIKFDSGNANKPSVFIIDQFQGSQTDHMRVEGFGKITLNSPLVWNDKALSTSGKSSGTWLYATHDLTFDGLASLTANNNSLTGDGGVMSIKGKLTLGNNVTMKNNSVAYVNHSSGQVITTPSDYGKGGALWVGADLHVGNNARFENNSSLGGDGGAIFVSRGSATFGELAVLNGNKSVQSTLYGFAVQGNGGAVYASKVMFGNSATLNNNVAYNGGAIYANTTAGAAVTFGNETTLKGNKSDGALEGGGAIYSVAGVKFGSYTRLIDNDSAASGGAIYTRGGGSEFGDYAILTGNKAVSSGGAVYNGDEYGEKYYGGHYVKFSNYSTLSQNQATEGGALYAKRGNITIGNYGVISENTASGSGGAMYVKEGDVYIRSNVVIAGNTAAASGGALYSAAAGGRFHVWDGKFYGISQKVTFENSVSLSANKAQGVGGAVYLAQGEVSFGHNAVVKDNSSDKSGGALYVDTWSGDEAGNRAPAEGNVNFGNNAVITNNKAGSGKGGAIYARTGITFGANTTFSENKALNTNSGLGGALYAHEGNIRIGNSGVISGNAAANGGAVYAYQGNIHIGDGGVISGNTASSIGGALYSGKGQGFFGNDTVVTNNSAAYIGGAAYSPSAITFGSRAVISGNTAGVSAPLGNGAGGALYSKNIFFFDGASIIGNSAGYTGGAIYLSNGSLQLMSRTTDTLISGNTANGIANAIHFGGSFGSLLLNAAAGHKIVLEDGVSSDGQSINIEINSDSSHGGGTVALHGPSANLNLNAITTVHSGTLELAQGAIWGNSGSSSLLLANGATLKAGGNSLLNSTFMALGGSTLSFDLASRDTYTSFSDALLHLANSAQNLGGKVNIDLSSLNAAGTYMLVQDWGSNQNFNSDVTVLGRQLPTGNTRIPADFLQAYTQNNHLMLNVGIVQNLDLTWTGNTDQAWDSGTYNNWKDSESRFFWHGDRVTFDANGTEKTVAIDANSVVVGDMTVKSDGYTFTGGGIVADAAASTLVGASGKLVISDNGSADFSGITGANWFKGGIAFNNGSLTLSDASQLGADFNAITFAGTNAIHFIDNNFVFDSGGTDRNRIVNGNGNLDILTQNNAGVTLSNAQSASDGGAVHSIDALRIGDNFRFIGNTAVNGGAIYSGAGLSLGANAGLSSNTASGNGGALFADSTTSFGKGVLLGNNSSGGDGGAIYSKGALTFSELAVLRQNAAHGDGGALFAESTASFGKGVLLGNNSAGGNGGALFGTNTSNLIISGGALIQNNEAKGKGGAIYSTGMVNLNADNGNIIFRGNTANGEADAIYMGGGSLNMHAGDGRTIHLYDPVSGSGSVTVNINSNNTDTGTVRLDQYFSDITANTTASHGTFELANGAGWGAASNVGAFTLNNSATLRVSGKDSSSIAADQITLNKSKLSFDPGAFTGNGAILLLNSDKSVDYNNDVIINITSLARHLMTTTTLVEAQNQNTNFSGIGDANLRYKDGLINGTRLEGLVKLETTTQPYQINLVQTGAILNFNLTWTGNTDNAWNFTTTNNLKDSDNTARLFFDGDAVTFDSSGANQSIAVRGSGLDVAGMAILGGDYTFAGGMIAGTSITSLSNPSQRLEVHGGATARFETALDFANGYHIFGGGDMTYAKTHAGSAIRGDIENEGRFTFEVMPNETLEYADSISGSGILGKAGSGTLILSGRNTYTGDTAVKGGTLAGNIANNTNLTVESNATYDGTGAARFVNILRGDGSIINTDSLIVQGGTFGGIISGTGALTKNGAGTLTLSGANSYTGLTEVRGGTLALSGAGTISPELALYGGTTFVTGGAAVPLSRLDVLGETNWQGSNLNMANQVMNFSIPLTISRGGTMLHVADTADITGSTVNVGINGPYVPLRAGDSIVLMDAQTLIGMPATTSIARWMWGVTQINEVDIVKNGNQLLAIVTGSLNPQTKSLSEGFLAGTVLTNQGAELVSVRGIYEARNAAGQTDGYGAFGAISGGFLRYNTGSHVNMNSLSLMAGLAGGRDVATGRLTVGAFFEYSSGSYDTYNSFSNAASVNSNGNTWYAGGGLLGRIDFTDTGPGRFYAETSVRTGKIHNEYKGGSLRDVLGRSANYESSSPYYSLYAGTGYLWNLTDKATLDMYGKYFWTRQRGDSVTLTTGDPVSFANTDSSRLRLGGRFTRTVSETFRPYVGLAYEYEFDGKVHAMTGGFDIAEPSLKGSTGMCELGISFTSTGKKSGLSFDLSVQGYTGVREGVTGSFQLKYEF